MDELLQHFNSPVAFKFLAALVALLNPLYGIPIFLAMTDGYTPAERRRTASVIGVTVLVAALAATLVGEEILAFFGISVSAFQIAGGIIVLGIALAMIKDDPPVEGDTKAAATGHKRRKNIAVVPLSIPLTIGPGVFATIILFAHLLEETGEVASMVPVVILVCLLVWVGLVFADPIARFLGETVISIVTRVMAIILAAVAIEMMISGSVQAIKDSFPGIAGSAALGS